MDQTLKRLLNILNCQLGVVSLKSDLDIHEVTEIFVRINSQGKRLNEADFAMSKIAADERFGGNRLRKAIDYFCHLAVDPSFYRQLSENDPEFMQSEYAAKLKWLKDDYDDIYDPDYNDMLRVSFMHKFGRAKLSDLVGLLSGRDFQDRSFKEEIARESFEKLASGAIQFMGEHNFTQFVKAIRSAGYIHPKLLNSQMTLDFAYTLYLFLQSNDDTRKEKIQRYVQKWFVLSTLTGRYVSSPESQMERDLRSIANKGIDTFLQETEESELSDTFWRVSLVQNLETASPSSPYFSTFLAAQIYGGDRSLFSRTDKVSDLISSGNVHHIFPKEFLKQSGITERSRYNQVANYTYLDSTKNISIGKRAPNDYFNAGRADLDKEELFANLKANCIPPEIFTMSASDYDSFLYKRRVLMAEKMEQYNKSL